ncbi:MAG: M20/M25/M40 family metallo-hydrolase [Phototrophicaceae bacterium]
MKTQSHTHKNTFWIIVWLAFVLVACNLGAAPAAQPPTLSVRSTATPVATLGFTGTGNQVVEVAGNLSSPVINIDVELRELTDQVDVGRLRTHVETLQGFTTRHVNSSTTQANYGIGAARTYIYNQFVAIQNQSQGRFIAQTLEFDLTHASIPTRQQNILGLLQGTSPGAGFIIIGAHYDSINTDFADGVGFAPGANDNGTGVAGLIEIARVLSQSEYRSTIIFVAFSAEEVGRQGSKAFVDWAQDQRLDIAGMINIDSIGNNNNRAGNVDPTLRIFSCEEEVICRDDGASRHMARSMEFLGFAHSAALDMFVQRQADRDGRYGDHFSFAEAGYPAIRFINALEEFGNGSTQDTSNFVEFDFLRQSVQSILLMTVAIADGPPPPRNITLRTDANGSPTLLWDSVPEAAGYVIALREVGSTRYDLQVNWANVTSMLYDPLTSGQYVGVAIGTRGENGLIGRLSNEYPLGG